MFLKNLMKQPIGPFTFEGYEFILPSGVCSIYEPAGKFLVRDIYKVESKEAGTGGIPPVIEAKEKEWDNVTYAEVKRFQINVAQFPSRQDLIRIAEKRGVDRELIERFKYEDEFDNIEIVNIINTLPIPEELRFPDRKTEKATNENNS